MATDPLISAAGGDFIATLAAVLVMFIIGIFAYFITKILPDQMQRDRDVITSRMDANQRSMCDEMGKMILAMYENNSDLKSWLEKHDEQAKKILENGNRLEATLSARPCLKR